jgi:hypothetical protein
MNVSLTIQPRRTIHQATLNHQPTHQVYQRTRLTPLGNVLKANRRNWKRFASTIEQGGKLKMKSWS